MPPAALPNLYCLPNDVFDYLGVPAAELRMDDENLATGQVVTVAADAAPGDTSLSVAPLRFPLIKGSTLHFDGGGMAEVVEVVLSATARVGDVTLAVSALAGAVLNQAQATDSGLNVATAARLLQACKFGTSKVQRYCLARYNDSDLATTVSAQYWATIMAAQWLARRCLRAEPESLKNEAEEVVEELKGVRAGTLSVETVSTRTAGWPFLDNMTVNPAYTNHKLRLQPSISEGTPTQFGNWIDYSDAYFSALEIW